VETGRTKGGKKNGELIIAVKSTDTNEMTAKKGTVTGESRVAGRYGGGDGIRC